MNPSGRITATSAWSCVLGSALLAVSTAHANLRAPLLDAHDGSSALYPAPSLGVEREELDFDCEETACEVAATYTLRAREPQTLLRNRNGLDPVYLARSSVQATIDVR